MGLDHWTRTGWYQQVPSVVADVLATLRHRGAAGYIVGGAVRNLFWGIPVADWDIASSASADALLGWFPGARAPGLRFGTVIVAPGIEVTTMRSEAGYLDGRHPSQVMATGSLETDLARRDFTVNAVAWDGREAFWGMPESLLDLSQRRMRAVGEASQRFSEDALRVLRLARLATVHRAGIEVRTFDAACQAADGTIRSSKERRLGELLALCAGPNRRWGMVYALGLCGALEIPRRWPDLSGVPASLSVKGTAALYLFLRVYGVAGEAGQAWAERWPLPRPCRKALQWAFERDWPGVPNRRHWYTLAGQLGSGGALFRELGPLVFGEMAKDWMVVGPAISALQIQQEFGLCGASLGGMMARVQGWVREHPRENHEAVLRQQIRRWMETV